MNNCTIRELAPRRSTGFVLPSGDSNGSLDSRQPLRSFASHLDLGSAAWLAWLLIALIVLASVLVFHFASADKAKVPGTPPTSGPFARAGLRLRLKALLLWLLIPLGFFVGMASAVFAGGCGRRAWRVLARGFTVVLLAAALLVPQALAAAPAAGAVDSAPSAWSAQPAPAGALFAAVDLKQAIRSFLEFLGWVLILVGVCLVAYGAILLAQGRHTLYRREETSRPNFAPPAALVLPPAGSSSVNNATAMLRDALTAELNEQRATSQVLVGQVQSVDQLLRSLNSRTQEFRDAVQESARLRARLQAVSNRLEAIEGRLRAEPAQP